jgi:hypothetical protein
VSLVRNDSIYVAWQTRRRLKWIAKAENKAQGVVTAAGATADEVADRLLNEIMDQRYPQLAEWEKKILATEDEIVRSIADAVQFPDADDEPATGAASNG